MFRSNFEHLQWFVKRQNVTRVDSVTLRIGRLTIITSETLLSWRKGNLTCGRGIAGTNECVRSGTVQKEKEERKWNEKRGEHCCGG